MQRGEPEEIPRGFDQDMSNYSENELSILNDALPVKPKLGKIT
jgi:hypothetical protein